MFGSLYVPERGPFNPDVPLEPDEPDDPLVPLDPLNEKIPISNSSSLKKLVEPVADDDSKETGTFQ